MCKDIQHVQYDTFKHIDGEIWGTNPHPYICGLMLLKSPNTMFGSRRLVIDTNVTIYVCVCLCVCVCVRVGVPVYFGNLHMLENRLSHCTIQLSFLAPTRTLPLLAFYLDHCLLHLVFLFIHLCFRRCLILCHSNNVPVFFQ